MPLSAKRSVEADALRAWAQALDSLPGGVRYGFTWYEPTRGVDAVRVRVRLFTPGNGEGSKPFAFRVDEVPMEASDMGRLMGDIERWAIKAALAWCEYPERFDLPANNP